jgi:hypothetical protein
MDAFVATHLAIDGDTNGILTVGYFTAARCCEVVLSTLFAALRGPNGSNRARPRVQNDHSVRRC